MTYTRGQPNEDNQGLESQPILLANTNALDDIFDTDHYKFSDSTTNRGKHKAIRFKTQTVDPATEDDEFAIYAKEDSDTDLNLFYRLPSSGAINQLTKDGNLYSGLIPVAAANFSDSAIVTELNVGTFLKVATGRYKLTYTTPIGNNNYEWSVSGMGASTLLNAAPQAQATYSDSVNTAFIILDFRNSSGTRTDILRGSVMIFRQP